VQSADAGFDWDDGNRAKCQKHGVSLSEIEFVLSHPVAIYPSRAVKEKRNFAIGKNSKGRYVFVVFTVRQVHGQERLRAISARYMHRKEIDRYEEEA
jgi:uncharacterized DUF497 family protein